MNIEKEFGLNYPDCVYIKHKFIDIDKVAVAYVIINPVRMTGGIKVFEIKDSKVRWWRPLKEYSTSLKLGQKTR